MDQLDIKIQQALQQSDIGSMDITDKASAYDEVMSTFQGNFKVIMILGVLKLVATEVLFVYACYAFFQQQSVMAMLAWASVAIMCMVITSAIIIVFYGQINKNAVNRDIKRLELQIALLIKQLHQNQS